MPARVGHYKAVAADATPRLFDQMFAQFHTISPNSKFPLLHRTKSR